MYTPTTLKTSGVRAGDTRFVNGDRLAKPGVRGQLLTAGKVFLLA